MKLYIYDHCPFCARVAYIAQSLGLDIELVSVDYDDAQTLIDLIGKKMVPVLQKDDGSIMAESLDIIAYFMDLKSSDEQRVPSEQAAHFQSRAFPLTQQIGRPRWWNLDLAEYRSAGSKEAWRASKETEDFNFEELLEKTPQFVQLINPLLKDAELLLDIEHGESSQPLIDQAVYFSMLRGFCVEPSISWPPALERWLEKKSETLKLSLLR
ncbi:MULTISPECIES: glutaredoxin 2 [unclassified Vibrio]|uniref:glutaredoxin 2 n=1 Tax=unclassified Vibrio TaxID=2614977 RepID=UPI000C8597D5|nr:MULTISPECIES: glutaredoxin 2 [unclassified Vibrio]PMI22241.1 glutaredoxin [Vibrio sp. 10N.286.46.E10]PMI99383.1 glutaredoxin [Vibrio sp. 10N.286.45.E10]PTO99592.1 glutaredoxin [Vibrio sp. 10N.286.45.A3]PTQ22319.1 glutaredoxin [Vibrio sp. 10N.286.46.E10]TKE75702.1 glutaredoxin 2 [Vibrio sp. F12]